MRIDHSELIRKSTMGDKKCDAKLHVVEYVCRGNIDCP